MEEILARLPRKLQLDSVSPGASTAYRGSRLIRRRQTFARSASWGRRCWSPWKRSIRSRWRCWARGSSSAGPMAPARRSTTPPRASTPCALDCCLCSPESSLHRRASRPRRAGSAPPNPTHVATTSQIEPFLEQIRSLFAIDRETTDALKYCFSELLRNVFEHSDSLHGGVIAAGHYGRDEEQRVTLALADLGVGVPRGFP